MTKTVTEHIRKHLYATTRKVNLYQILKGQWSDEFEMYRKNRMIMGYFRYGKVRETMGKYDNVQSMFRRLEKFQETKNTEYLVDIANLCMIEFMYGDYFESIDDGEHTQKWRDK